MRLPSEFIAFCETNGINAVLYDEILKCLNDGQLPMRYFYAVDASVAAIEAEFPGVRCVPWASGFYCVEGSVKLSESKLWRDGRVLGMDVSSGIAVQALKVQPGEHILDLCCAPGTKLVLLSQLTKTEQTPGSIPNGTVTGVDISKHRLATCRSVVKKHKVGNVRLFLEDGTTFSEGAPEASSKTASSKPFYAPKTLRSLVTSSKLYDKVLVDAECTHDGSIVHLIKAFEEQNWKDSGTKFMDGQRLEKLQQLQRELLSNGFQLLKPGGILVYSTCSFSRKQNEEIVQWLLNENPETAALEDIGLELPKADEKLERIVSSMVLDETGRHLKEIYEKSVRFHGGFDRNEKFWTSGFYLAKIKKWETGKRY